MSTQWEALPAKVRDLVLALTAVPHPRPGDTANYALKLMMELKATPRNFAFTPWMGEHPREGVRWTDAEAAELLRGYDAGHSLEALAKHHGRRVNGITSRLAKLGRRYWERKQSEDESELETLRRRVEALERRVGR